jgi:hypothetical protein
MLCRQSDFPTQLVVQHPCGCRPPWHICPEASALFEIETILADLLLQADSEHSLLLDDIRALWQYAKRNYDRHIDGGLTCC